MSNTFWHVLHTARLSKIFLNEIEVTLVKLTLHMTKWSRIKIVFRVLFQNIVGTNNRNFQYISLKTSIQAREIRVTSLSANTGLRLKISGCGGTAVTLKSEIFTLMADIFSFSIAFQLHYTNTSTLTNSSTPIGLLSMCQSTLSMLTHQSRSGEFCALRYLFKV